MSRIWAASLGVKPSTAVSRKAWRERGAMRISRRPAWAGLVQVAEIARLELGPGDAPDGMEHVIEGHARGHVGVERLVAARQRLKRDPHVLVAGGLVAGEGPRIAPDVGKVRRELGDETQEGSPVRIAVTARARESAPAKQRRETAKRQSRHLGSSDGAIQCISRGNPPATWAFAPFDSQGAALARDLSRLLVFAWKESSEHPRNDLGQ